MNAVYRLVKDTIIATPACPDGPVGACPSCLASAIAEALELGAARERHPAGKQIDDQLDLLQAVCAHVFGPELEACQLCGLEYQEWSK